MEFDAPGSIALLQGLYERSTHLVLKLYALSLQTSTCRMEIVQLTHQIENFPNSTRQIISWLEQAPQLRSQQALNDVQEIADECHRAFDRVEELSSRVHDNAEHGGDGSIKEMFFTDSLLRKELIYLTTLLQAMLLTLNVMMHAFLSAKMSMDHDNGQNVEMIQKQIEGLVIRQQLVLINAAQLYHNFIENRLPSAPNENISPTSIPQADQPPAVLLRYQERSLHRFYVTKPGSEGEILAQVLAVSQSQMWNLLKRWTTRFGSGDPISPEVEVHDIVVNQPVKKEKKRSKKNSPKQSMNPELSYPTPNWPASEYQAKPEFVPNIMTPMLTPPTSEFFQTEPISVPGPSRMTRTHSSPVGPVGLGISSQSPSPYYQHQFTPASAPLTEPRFNDPAPSVISTRSSTNGTADQDEEEPIIRWRIRYQKAKWEFDNDQMVSTNTAMKLKHAIKEPNAITEIRRRKIARRVLKENGYRYRLLPQEDREEWSKGGNPKIRDFWRIEGGLTYADICDLVRQTEELDGPQSPSGKQERRSSIRSQRRNSLNRTYSEQPRRSSTMGQWPEQLETMEEHDEDTRERKDKRGRRPSVSLNKEEQDKDRRHSTSRARRESDGRRDSVRSTNYEGDKRDRRASTRDREQGKEVRDKDKDGLKVVGATTATLGLLTLLGPLAGLSI